MDLIIFVSFFLVYIPKYAYSYGDHSVQYFGPSIVSEGDPFALSCVTPFHDNATWTLNGSAITDENLLGYELLERRIQETFFKEMILKTASAQLFHSGEYRCNKKNRDYHFLKVVEDVETTTTEGTELSPNKHSKRDDGEGYPKRYFLEVNNDYQFLCEVENEDYPIVWYKNMRQIDSFSYPSVELYDRNLVIHNAQVEDVGEYSCRLDAPYQPGKRDVISKYLLTSPAEIIDISERQNVIKGRTMELFCRAKGYPSPRITWYIDNVSAFVLREKDYRISIYSRREKTSNSYLIVRNMSNSDKGLYTCRAENGFVLENGIKYHEKSIPVYVRENIIEPNEDEPGVGKVLVPGRPLFLQCKIEECPPCSVVWFKEGEKLSANENDLYIDEENNSLMIHSATMNDTGLYECAVNRMILDVDLRATIKVQICEDLLSEGITIESLCEMPMTLEQNSSARKQFSTLHNLLLIAFVSLLLKLKS